MLRHLIVPIDGSPHSWRAFDVAVELAQRCDSDIRLVEVAWDPADGRQADTLLRRELARRAPFDVEIHIDVRLSAGSVASELRTVVSLHPDAVVVMSSHGKGRAAAIVGSVTEDTIRAALGPIVLVGPHVESSDLSGPVIVAVDGSAESEAALPLAAAWARRLGTTPRIVHVDDLPSDGTNDRIDTSYPARLAAAMRTASGRPADFDVLHDRHPARALSDHATRHRASLIVATSHGRSGLSRLVMGSTTAGFVRTATCPILVVRLPHSDPAHAERRDRMWAFPSPPGLGWERVQPS